MVLHTVNKTTCLARCLSLVEPGDAVLLIEDGVYATLESGPWSALPDNVACYALAADLAARGISDKMLPRFESASWPQFVTLATTYDKVISWG